MTVKNQNRGIVDSSSNMILAVSTALMELDSGEVLVLNKENYGEDFEGVYYYVRNVLSGIKCDITVTHKVDAITIQILQ